jgi:cytohesin
MIFFVEYAERNEMSGNYAADFMFHAMAEVGNLKGLQGLLERMDDERRRETLSRRDERGFSVLHRAAEMGHAEVVGYLIEMGADPQEEVEGEEPEAWTGLHLAAFGDHPAVVECLVEAGVEVDVEDADGMTPLVIATGRGSLAAFKALVDGGATVGVRDGDGFTPLHHASYNGLMEMVETLLERGADVNAAAEDGSRPLDWARQGGEKKVAELLEKRGGGVGTSVPPAPE